MIECQNVGICQTLWPQIQLFYSPSKDWDVSGGFIYGWKGGHRKPPQILCCPQSRRITLIDNSAASPIGAMLHKPCYRAMELPMQSHHLHVCRCNYNLCHPHPIWINWFFCPMLALPNYCLRALCRPACDLLHLPCFVIPAFLPSTELLHCWAGKLALIMCRAPCLLIVVPSASTHTLGSIRILFAIPCASLSYLVALAHRPYTTSRSMVGAWSTPSSLLTSSPTHTILLSSPILV